MHFLNTKNKAKKIGQFYFDHKVISNNLRTNYFDNRDYKSYSLYYTIKQSLRLKSFVVTQYLHRYKLISQMKSLLT